MPDEPKPKSPNRIAAETFAAEFDPPLKIAPTQFVGGVAVEDAWTCSWHETLSDGTKRGLTVAFYDGVARGWIESLCPGAETATLASIFRAALGLKARA